jgi:hypothetical protein
MVDTNSSYNARVEQAIDKTVCPKMPVDFRKDWSLRQALNTKP